MNSRDTESEAGPLQVRGTVLTVRRVDAYHAITIVAPGIAARFKPGQFVAVAVGGPDTSMLLRRAFSIHDVRSDHGGTVEFVFAVTGRGTRWLAERRARDTLDLTGPLGRPFPVPRDPVSCLLVGGGYGSAPLFALADRLRERRCSVDFLLGAASGDRVFGALTARRTGRSATITTDDGSLGVARDRDRHARPGDSRGADRRHLRLRTDADASPGDGPGQKVRHPGAGGR